MTHRTRQAAAIFLMLVSCFHVGAWVDLLTEGDNVLRENIGNVFWPSRWRMFNGYSTKGSAYLLEFDSGDGWEPLDMTKHYPFEWCHGPRWQRSDMKRSRSYRRPFLAAACTHVEAPRVRMIRKTWKLKLGTFQPTPPPSAKVGEIEIWNCSKPAPNPGGVVF